MPFSAPEALKRTIVLLSGEEHELRRRALTAILAELGPSDDDFDREEFDAGSSDYLTWMGSASTVPFLSERRVVIVRHILRQDPDDVKLPDLPPSALLVLVADEEAGDDDKQRRFRTDRKSTRLNSSH